MKNLAQSIFLGLLIFAAGCDDCDHLTGDVIGRSSATYLTCVNGKVTTAADSLLLSYVDPDNGVIVRVGYNLTPADYECNNEQQVVRRSGITKVQTPGTQAPTGGMPLAAAAAQVARR